MKKLLFFIAIVAIGHTSGFAQGCLPEGITFATQAQIDSFPINYPGCTVIEGNVIIRGGDITNLNGLSVLTSIGGNLEIGLDPGFGVYNGNPILTSLDGLQGLTLIGGGLRICSDDLLLSLSGLDNLISIGGDLDIYMSSSITSIASLDGLTNIPGHLRIEGSSLTSLSGLENVTSIGGYLTIGGNGVLTSLSALGGLTAIGGGLDISGNGALTSLTGLEGITTIPGSLSIGGDNALSSLSALGGLTSIVGDFLIWCNTALLNLSGLENLSTIGGLLDIEGTRDGCYPALTSLEGLEGLTSVGGIKILYCHGLKSLTGIDNINSSSISSLYIRNSYSLSTCEVKSICDYLAAPGGTIDIHYNATGCKTQQEVEDACANVGVDRNPVTDFVVYPNPTSGLLTIESPGTSVKSQLTILNLSGQEIMEKTITEPTTLLDISHLPAGIYVVRLANDKTVETVKLVKR